MTPIELLHRWHFRADRMQGAYYEAARRSSGLHVLLGIPAAALSTIVGTSVFLSLSNGPDPTVQLVTGLLSVAAALLAGLQTFLRHSETAEQYRVAGARFANLKQRLELLLAFHPPPVQQFQDDLAALEKAWDEIRKESPNLPSGLWKRIEREFEPEEHGE